MQTNRIIINQNRRCHRKRTRDKGKQQCQTNKTGKKISWQEGDRKE
jgi:hypothetical protein